MTKEGQRLRRDWLLNRCVFHPLRVGHGPMAGSGPTARQETGVERFAVFLPALAMTQAQALPAGVGGPAAVDYQGVAIHEAALRGISQEKDGLGNVVR